MLILEVPSWHINLNICTHYQGKSSAVYSQCFHFILGVFLHQYLNLLTELFLFFNQWMTVQWKILKVLSLAAQVLTFLGNCLHHYNTLPLAPYSLPSSWSYGPGWAGEVQDVFTQTYLKPCYWGLSCEAGDVALSPFCVRRTYYLYLELAW